MRKSNIHKLTKSRYFFHKGPDNSLGPLTQFSEIKKSVGRITLENRVTEGLSSTIQNEIWFSKTLLTGNLC